MFRVTPIHKHNQTVILRIFNDPDPRNAERKPTNICRNGTRTYSQIALIWHDARFVTGFLTLLFSHMILFCITDCAKSYQYCLFNGQWCDKYALFWDLKILTASSSLVWYHQALCSPGECLWKKLNQLFTSYSTIIQFKVRILIDFGPIYTSCE